MKRVVVESPCKGEDGHELMSNIEYARACVKDCINRGEAPIAGHLLYTQEGILDDSIPSERKAGIDLHLAWIPVVDKVVIYIDRGISAGMQQAIDYCIKYKYRYETRSLEKPIDTCLINIGTSKGNIHRVMFYKPFDQITHDDVTKAIYQHFYISATTPPKNIPFVTGWALSNYCKPLEQETIDEN